jgi:transmembrane sensor
MNDRTEADRDRADADAAAWLVRLAEAPGDAELRAGFAAWHDAHPLHAAVWARTERAYHVLGRHRPVDRSLWQASYRRSRRFRFALAAAALCAGLALSSLPNLLLHLQSDLTTATAELGSLSLPDGSEIELAPESAIDTLFTGGARGVRLLKGEAYFSVTHDPAHPFTVIAGDAVVTVLGTAFDVRMDAGGTLVAVEHGKVQVEDRASPASHRLGAGDWLALTAGKYPVRGHDAAPEVAAWRHGRLVVRDRPAAEIVAALRPYLPGLILLRNPAFATRRVSGIYDLRDPAATLQALAESYGAKLVRLSPWITLVTEK